MSEQNSEPSRPVDPQIPPPPAPPVPIVPSSGLPAVPKYGEYANPYGVPGYAAVTPSAPVAPAAPNPYGAPGYAPAKKRRTWDAVLTCILLVLGLFGTGAALGYAAIFANPEVLSQAMSSQGYGTFSGHVGAAPAVLAISHIVLYLLALGLSIPLLVRGKVVVFWIPLAIGVIAAIIFWATVITVITSDPGFLAHYGA